MPTLDPKAYEAIRKCVQQAAEDQRLQEELQQYIASHGLPTALPTGLPNGLPITSVTLLPTAAISLPPGAGAGTGELKACEEAATYLK